jgi:hypothetical protein
MEKHMNIKRAFVSLLAVMMLPAVANAGDIPPIPLPVEPADGTAVLFIQKVFTDGNNETPVTLRVQCNNGTPTQDSVTVFPDDPFQPAGIFGQVEVAFVIENIALINNEGATCTVTEDPVPGYSTSYFCGPFTDATPDTTCLPGHPDNKPATNLACKWSDVQSNRTQREGGDVARCLITNDVKPVPVSVTKVWDITNAGGDYFDTSVNIRIVCNSEIVDYDSNRGRFYDKAFYIPASDFEAGKGTPTTEGEETVTAMVYPKFDRSDSPNHDVKARCWAEEDAQADSAVEVENGCGYKRSAKLEALIGGGGNDSCTITNTLFFEGIPTLSQYGMAVMALLMLGVGFVGLRRFV